MLSNVEAKALVETLDETLPVTDAETLCYTLEHGETFALVKALAHILAKAKTNTSHNYCLI